MHVELARNTLRYLRGADVPYWYMENPRAMMRRVVGPPSRTVTYCSFGERVMKPTDLWGRHAPMTWPKTCKNENPRCDHERAPAGSRSGVQGLGNREGEKVLSAKERAALRSLVPYGLSLAICEAVERANL